MDHSLPIRLDSQSLNRRGRWKSYVRVGGNILAQAIHTFLNLA
jgi:hypothetical protein